MLNTILYVPGRTTYNKCVRVTNSVEVYVDKQTHCQHVLRTHKETQHRPKTDLSFLNCTFISKKAAYTFANSTVQKNIQNVHNYRYNIAQSCSARPNIDVQHYKSTAALSILSSGVRFLTNNL